MSKTVFNLSKMEVGMVFPPSGAPYSGRICFSRRRQSTSVGEGAFVFWLLRRFVFLGLFSSEAMNHHFLAGAWTGN